MRIISKFKDYYDSAAGYGVDTSVIYERTSKPLPSWSREEDRQADVLQYREIAAACRAMVHPDRFRQLYRHAEFKTVFVGVAGKIYVGLILPHGTFDEEKQLWQRIRDGMYCEMYAWKPENLTDKQLDQKIENAWPNTTEVTTVREWFALNENARVVENVDLFTKYNMVSFVAVQTSAGTSVQINERLQDYGFQRMMDGFTAFQEISMFVTGVLAQQDQMTHVPTDKELLYARGHDDMSFKTPPTKRR